MGVIRLEHTPESWIESVPDDHEARNYEFARYALKVVMQLDMVLREVVCRRLAGDTFRQIVGHLNGLLQSKVSVAVLHARLAKEITAHPILADLFAEVLEKKQRRKHAGAKDKQ